MPVGFIQGFLCYAEWLEHESHHLNNTVCMCVRACMCVRVFQSCHINIKQILLTTASLHTPEKLLFG